MNYKLFKIKYLSTYLHYLPTYLFCPFNFYSFDIDYVESTDFRRKAVQIIIHKLSSINNKSLDLVDLEDK